jgi:alpha-D-xyloside xylohydrolase
MALWTADLGGYLTQKGAPDPKLFMRWTQYSAFSPTMELLSTSNRGPWDYGDEALKNYRKYAVLHMSLFPYRYAAAQEAAKTGMPIMRALVLEYQNDQRAREAKDEYLFGNDLLVAPVIGENTSRAVYLPGGDWIDYWSGKPLSGSTEVIADAPLDVLPLYVRAGAILPKIPEDVMTLVPPAESGNATIKSLDDRRVYELVPAANDSQSVTITDFEGRNLARSAHSLEINGKAARVTVRWRFDPINSVTLGGTPLDLHTDAGGRYVEFDHAGRSTLNWK